jgi:hypothetical protein
MLLFGKQDPSAPPRGGEFSIGLPHRNQAILCRGAAALRVSLTVETKPCRTKPFLPIDEVGQKSALLTVML